MMSATAKPELRPVTYKGWEGWQLARGPLALTVVPQIGGRVMGIQWRGQELSFVNPVCEGRIVDVAAISDVHASKQQLGFLLWGGEKTWPAPQSRWTDDVPFIDLDSGAYEFACDEHAGTATMISPVCRETGVQIERTVALGDAVGHWKMRHTLRNRSDQPVTWAPWSVAMLLRPAMVFIPVSASSAFSDGLRSFDNEGVSSSVRQRVVAFGDEVAAITCRDPMHFKYGSDAPVGRVLTVMETGAAGAVGLRKSVPTYHLRPYAHGCVIEVFNSDAHPYFEVEVHGPVTTLLPGESFTLAEDLALFDLDTAIDDRAAARFLLGGH